jgi:hypothetical protein
MHAIAMNHNGSMLYARSQPSRHRPKDGLLTFNTKTGESSVIDIPHDLIDKYGDDGSIGTLLHDRYYVSEGRPSGFEHIRPPYIYQPRLSIYDTFTKQWLVSPIDQAEVIPSLPLGNCYYPAPTMSSVMTSKGRWIRCLPDDPNLYCYDTLTHAHSVIPRTLSIGGGYGYLRPDIMVTIKRPLLATSTGKVIPASVDHDYDDFVLLISWIAFDNNDGSVRDFQLLDPVTKQSWSLIHNGPPLRGYATTEAFTINGDEPYYDGLQQFHVQVHQHQQQWLVLGRGCKQYSNGAHSEAPYNERDWCAPIVHRPISFSSSSSHPSNGYYPPISLGPWRGLHIPLPVNIVLERIVGVVD